MGSDAPRNPEAGVVVVTELRDRLARLGIVPQEVRESGGRPDPGLHQMCSTGTARAAGDQDVSALGALRCPEQL
eukprot:11336279-Heterocapsa_arctica.AAC.1